MYIFLCCALGLYRQELGSVFQDRKYKGPNIHWYPSGEAYSVCQSVMRWRDYGMGNQS